MTATEAIAEESAPPPRRHQRKASNAILQPFLQFKLLLYMLGSTIVVAILLAAFLYFAFNDLLEEMAAGSSASNYHVEMIEMQLVHLLHYCGVLFVLYVLLLAVVCIAYTHKLIGPFNPFNRHVDGLLAGDYSSRVHLRKADPDLFQDYADKLNALAENLEERNKAT